MSYYTNQGFRERLKARYNWCCAWCGDERNVEWTRSTLCIDHVQTRFSGGSDYDYNNFQVLCRRCNAIKGAYCLPKLEPRMPETDLDVVFAKQEKLRVDIMQARRRSSEGLDYPTRAELGY